MQLYVSREYIFSRYTAYFAASSPTVVGESDKLIEVIIPYFIEEFLEFYIIQNPVP